MKPDESSFKLHSLYEFQLIQLCLAISHCDDPVLAHLINSIGYQVAHGFITIGRDNGHLRREE